jgi:DNA invertase Pin-like site-specific DNA recombinase
MPRPLRQPTDVEKAELDIIADINQTIVKNIDRNKKLSQDRRERVQSLIERGWSMYGIALNTGITPNTVKRILSEKPQPKTLMQVFAEEEVMVDESVASAG